MAGLDYGLIISINNEIIKDTDDIGKIGDDDFYIDIYKYYVTVFVKGKIVRSFSSLIETTHDECDDIYIWKKEDYEKYSLRTKVNSIQMHFKKKDDGCILLKFKYKCNLYKIVYGYGVGFNVRWWWKFGLGLNKKKYKGTLKYLKHLK